MHERPGVYSSYDASTVVSAGRAAKVIGVAAKAVKGTAGEVVTLTGYAAGVAAFGEDAADTPGMSTILRLLFANGASTVAAVRVAEAGAVKDYQDAFAALGGEEARILVCDSAEETVQQALPEGVEPTAPELEERPLTQADLALTETFLAIGVDELSVTPRSVLPLRNAVRMTDTRETSERILAELDSDYTAR
mgnify:CR=1 FL=1